MILIIQTYVTGEILGKLEADEIRPYLAACKAAGRHELARLVEAVENNPPGAYEIHCDDRSFTTVVI